MSHQQRACKTIKKRKRKKRREHVKANPFLIQSIVYVGVNYQNGTNQENTHLLPQTLFGCHAQPNYLQLSFPVVCYGNEQKNCDFQVTWLSKRMHMQTKLLELGSQSSKRALSFRAWEVIPKHLSFRAWEVIPKHIISVMAYIKALLAIGVNFCMSEYGNTPNKKLYIFLLNSLTVFSTQ